MIKCGHCGGRHASAMDVRNCSGTQVADSARAAEEAWAYLGGVQDKIEYAKREDAQERAAYARKAGVDVLERPAPTQVTEDGMYRKADGRIFKVQRAIHGSGRLYAKQLVLTVGDNGGPTGTLTEIPLVGDTLLQVYDARFIYMPGAIKHLSAEERMTMEQAKEFGALYGTCCRCGLQLTDEKSIEAGIGPVCAKKI